MAFNAEKAFLTDENLDHFLFIEERYIFSCIVREEKLMTLGVFSLFFKIFFFLLAYGEREKKIRSLMIALFFLFEKVVLYHF